MQNGFVRLGFESLESRENPSSFWEDTYVGAFLSGAGEGAVNMGKGVYMVAHDLVTAPIDIVVTAADAANLAAGGNSFGWAPLSYYGESSQQAQQAGTPWYQISGEAGVNAASFGIYGLGKSGYIWYETGDPTAFQQTTGAFAAGAFIGYRVQLRAQAAAAADPVYNLGGTGEVPGAVNVQPPNVPLPPEPYLIAPSDQLPMAPNSGNIVSNSSPIAPQSINPATGRPGFLGPPYQPGQIAGIAGGGHRITIGQPPPEGMVAGTITPGQQAVIAAAPPGSNVTLTTGELPGTNMVGTIVTITTPTPWAPPLIPTLVNAPNANSQQVP